MHLSLLDKEEEEKIDKKKERNGGGNGQERVKLTLRHAKCEHFFNTHSSFRSLPT